MLLVALVKVSAAAPTTMRVAANHQYPGASAARVRIQRNLLDGLARLSHQRNTVVDRLLLRVWKSGYTTHVHGGGIKTGSAAIGEPSPHLSPHSYQLRFLDRQFSNPFARRGENRIANRRRDRRNSGLSRTGRQRVTLSN